MLVQICWSWTLLFVASTTALSSISSSHHSTTVIKTSVSSTKHTSLSTTKKTTIPTSSTHHPSSSSTKSSPTAVPSTFNLVAADSGQTALDGSHFKIILDPDPIIEGSGDKILQVDGKTSAGAASFTLNADGTLQCNSVSGPLVACVSNGHVFTQTFQFEPPANLDEYGLVAVTCAIAGGVLSCQWGPLDVFYLAPSDVVNGTQTGETVLFGETGDGTPFTIKIVPT